MSEFFVRTGTSKNDKEFAQHYKDLEKLLKARKRDLDSKHTRLAQNLLKDGDEFWGKVKAKSRQDYEKRFESYIKELEKGYNQINSYLAEVDAKAS